MVLATPYSFNSELWKPRSTTVHIHVQTQMNLILCHVHSLETLIACHRGGETLASNFSEIVRKEKPHFSRAIHSAPYYFLTFPLSFYFDASESAKYALLRYLI